MSEELPLFTQVQPALARRQDPDSSASAALWLRQSGKLARQERAVYGALRDHPGATARELAAVLGCADPNVPARRLAGLADRGLVHRGPKRACRVSRMLSQTWYAAAQKIGTLGGGRQTRTPPERGVTGPILSPADRQRLRERLTVEGNAEVRRFLGGLGDGRGGGSK